MVRSILFHGPGRALELTRRPLPELRPGEILVRISACTLCRSDLHTHAGRRSEPTPTVLGHEIVGRVEAFGPEASRVDAAGAALSAGARVTWAIVANCRECVYCRDDLPQKCERPYKYGHERATDERPFGGGLADFVVLTQRTVCFAVPDAISDRVAAPANCATATAAAVLRHGGGVEGRCVLVLGAGVLGATICAMARSAGARSVLAADTEAESLKRAIAFGATHALPAEPVELAARVAALTEGRGADVVLEMAGSAQLAGAALTLVRTGGTVVLAGTVAPVGNIAIDPEQVVRRMLTIRGVHNYHPRDLATALSFLAGPGRQFPFETLVGASYPLDQVEQAFAHAHTLRGVRVLVTPGSPVASQPGPV
jgi:putative phosphonate catabolism associated alcohol dehydrogenase